MNDVQFWHIIDRLQQVRYDDALGSSDERRDFQIHELRRILNELPASEIICFEEHFVSKMLQATTEELVAAASIVLESVSYDSFDYFASWLILQGQDAFNKVIRNPDSVMEVIPSGGFPQFEEIRSIPKSVYQSKTKKHFYANYDAKKFETARKLAFSKDWSESELRERFPRLCGLYLEE